MPKKTETNPKGAGRKSTYTKKIIPHTIRIPDTAKEKKNANEYARGVRKKYLKK